MIFRRFLEVVSLLFIIAVLGACSSEETPEAAVTADSEVEMPLATVSSQSDEDVAIEVQVEVSSGAEIGAQLESDSAVEASMPETQIVIDKHGLPEGLGKGEFERICSECHAVDTAIGMRRSQAEWQVVIQEMRDMGANASNIEAGLILAYLSQNFGN